MCVHIVGIHFFCLVVARWGVNSEIYPGALWLGSKESSWSVVVPPSASSWLGRSCSARLGSGLASSASCCLWAGRGSAGLRGLPGSGWLFFSRGVFWLALLGSSPYAGSALLVLWTFGGGVVGPGAGRLGLVCPARESGGGSRLLSFELLPRVMPWLRRYII